MQSTDNLPLGADNNPNAPFNEEVYEDIDVLISITYSKSVSLYLPKGMSMEELKESCRKYVFKSPSLEHDGWNIDEFEIIKE